MDNLVHRFNLREVAAAQEVGSMFGFKEKKLFSTGGKIFMRTEVNLLSQGRASMQENIS